MGNRASPPPNSPYRNTLHKARVVGDPVGAASLATQHVSTECRAAALLDGRHDLELAQAQVAALRLAPGGTMAAEDVGDLQGAVRHEEGLRGLQSLQRADHLAQDLGGDVRVDRRGLQPLVAEQHLDHPDVDLLLEQVGGKAVAPMSWKK